MKILNLYACLGGNRYKWDEVTDVDVTAVEYDPEAAKLYQERFANDKVVVADAHQYLLDHYKEFDFIWSSPPCPSHSRINVSQKTRDVWKARYPDMKLYEEIIFLQHYFEGKYVVENVVPYYEPLISAKKRDRHLYWTNFNLPNKLSDRGRGKNLSNMLIKELSIYHDFDFNKYNGKQSRLKMARNLVDYEAGKTILETAIGMIRKQNKQQTTIFDL